MKLKYISGSFGVEVLGIDISQTFISDDKQTLNHLLADKKVIIFRDQTITPEQHKAFAEIFGLPEKHYYYKTPNDIPEVSILESGQADSTTDNIWHSDGSYRSKPPLGSVLYSQVIPPSGGDTIWVDMEAAYAALSPAVQKILQGLQAIHDVTGGYGVTLIKSGEKELKEVQAKLPPVSHPVVRVHPVTKRKSLYISSSYTTSICGMNENESDSILNMLFMHLLIPEFQLRHHWDPNTMIVWDNRSTTHYAVADYGSAYRKMHRVSILSSEPDDVIKQSVASVIE